MSDHPGPIFAYFGHHKCASVWLQQILNDLCSALGLSTFRTHLAPQLPLRFELHPLFKERIRRARAQCASGTYDFLLAVNADSSLAVDLKLRGYRAFHVIRDPRDIIVSGYFSHMSTHPAHADQNPWLIKHRNGLLALNQEDGMLLELEYASIYLERLAQWDYCDPFTYETRFEILTEDPESEMRRMLAFCGILIGSSAAPEGVSRTVYCPEELYNEIMRHNAFEVISGGRLRGAQDQHSHFRRGLAGDYKKYFTKTIQARFNELYSGLVNKLGYEDFD